VNFVVHTTIYTTKYTANPQQIEVIKSALKGFVAGLGLISTIVDLCSLRPVNLLQT